MNFSSMTAKELYSEEVISEILSEEDPVMREQMIFDLEDRAAEFGKTVAERVKRMLKAAERDKKAREKERRANKNNDFDRYTDFGGFYPSMKCGSWRADSKGVYNPDAMPDNRLACPHPILPIETITNVEDGTYRIYFLDQGNGFGIYGLAYK